MRRTGLYFVALIALLGSGLQALAQDTSPDGSPPTIAALAAEVDQADAELRTIASGVRARNGDDAQLGAKIAAIPGVQAKLNDALAELTPRLADADARLAQLGPAPGPGQPPEDPEITQDRNRLLQFRESIDTEVKQAHLLAVEAEQIGGLLSDRRRNLFTARLWTPSRPFLDPALWSEAVRTTPRDVARAAESLKDEQYRLTRATGVGGWAADWSITAIVALALSLVARLGLERGVRRLASRRPDTSLRRSFAALAIVLATAGPPVCAALLLIGGLGRIEAMTPVFARLARALVNATAFAFVFEALGRALLSRTRPAWRLAPVSDGSAQRLAVYPGLVAVAAGLASLSSATSVILGLSAPTAAALSCVTLGIDVATVGAGLAALWRARGATSAEVGQGAELSPRHSRLPWILATLAAWLALLFACVALTAGYLHLASFLVQQVTWVALVLGLLFVLWRFVDDLFPALLGPSARIGRLLSGGAGVPQPVLEQAGVLLSGVCRLLLLLLGWVAILGRFGATAGEFFGRVTATDLVLRLGEVSISPGAVVGAIAVFCLGLGVTRALRGWLEQSYLPKTQMDVGVRASVAAAVTYLGALIAVLLACAYLGLSLDKIALFASALSVGIGFGLQSVIGNFVSGLILLAERPIKVGDWIAIGDLEGDVRKVSVRATEIEMNDKSKLIVPNSDLISKTVRNVTHGGAVGRVKIVLRLANDADPLAVRELMLAHLTAHPEVLKDPPAAVYMNDVRDGGLEFTAFAYVASPRLAYRVKSELLFGIVPDLNARKIALANSSPVVNVGLPDRAIEPEVTAG